MRITSIIQLIENRIRIIDEKIEFNQEFLSPKMQMIFKAIVFLDFNNTILHLKIVT